MYLFARNEAENRWLSEHPIVLGAGAILIGLILIGVGVAVLITGKAPARRGPDLEGANAKAYGWILVGFGGLAVLFGLFKIVQGAL